MLPSPPALDIGDELPFEAPFRGWPSLGDLEYRGCGEMVTASSVAVQDTVVEADNENVELDDLGIPEDFDAYKVRTDGAEVWWVPEPELVEA